ncbi:MAG: hydrogenase maturation protease [Candidatus Omnitrophica bacterium]|jgi:putative hydrolase of the HAD superfamily|nr:hydrogenase maturation protease [Candidatus Omnitrophota bacterium]
MKCLAFDLGKVLFDFDYGIALRKIETKIKVQPKEIINQLFFNDFAKDFEKGLVSTRDFYEKFKNAFKLSLTYEEFIDTWCDIFSLNKDVASLIEKLSYIYPVYLISNINELHFEYLHKNYPNVFSFFDELILSYKVKSLKPEKEIYQQLKDKSGYKYEDIIYVDDRPDLICEAKELNLKCINFTGFNELLAELNHHNITIPTEEEKTAFKMLKNEILRHKKTLIVGIGNTDKSDDGVGIYLTERIKNKTHLKTINTGRMVENYLGKIAKEKADLIIFIDCATLSSPQTFGCFSPNSIKDLPLHLTHDGSLSRIFEYLQNVNRSDILFLAISGFDYSLGQNLSKSAEKQLQILGNFFEKHFSADCN